MMTSDTLVEDELEGDEYMQVFCPYVDPFDTALVLDRKRLGRQRQEVMTILRAINGPVSEWKDPYAWSNHPTVKLWENDQMYLILYLDILNSMWEYLGYDGMKTRDFIDNPPVLDTSPISTTMRVLNGLEGLLLRDWEAYYTRKWNLRSFSPSKRMGYGYSIPLVLIPEWLDDSFTAFHREKLIEKDPDYYREHFDNCSTLDLIKGRVHRKILEGLKE